MSAESSERSRGSSLSAAQRAALDHVAAQGRAQRTQAQARLANVERMAKLEPGTLTGEKRKLLAAIRCHARVALHFHPDRPVGEGSATSTVAQRLLTEGVYRSQFETKISNGSVSAHIGGERDTWEAQLFGGVYQRLGSGLHERPKYGALDLLRPSDGPSPRFGSCYLLLAPAVSQRCTFTYLDSHEQRKERGTLASFEAVLAALFDDCFFRDQALGEHGVHPRELAVRIREQLAAETRQVVEQPPSRNLNVYIEAQVHGEVQLARDAQALVADPSFRGSDTGALLEELAARHQLELHWHRGYELAVADVPDDFRGPTMPSLAQQVAGEGSVNAKAIGQAVQWLHAEPGAWAERGSYDQVLQELKLLWHCTVQFGAPRGGVARREGVEVSAEELAVIDAGLRSAREGEPVEAEELLRRLRERREP